MGSKTAGPAGLELTPSSPATCRTPISGRRSELHASRWKCGLRGRNPGYFFPYLYKRETGGKQLIGIEKYFFERFFGRPAAQIGLFWPVFSRGWRFLREFRWASRQARTTRVRRQQPRKF